MKYSILNSDLILRKCVSCNNYVQYDGFKKGYCIEHSNYSENRIGCIKKNDFIEKDFIEEDEFKI